MYSSSPVFGVMLSIGSDAKGIEQDRSEVEVASFFQKGKRNE